MRKKRPGTLTPESFFSFSWRNTAVCIGILAAATGLCFLLRLLDDSDVYVALIFELAVVLVSRFTSGYFYGLLASVVGVIGVNYIFTYPYFAFNFTISGYPLTFLVMLAVSIVVSALTTQIKQQEKDGNERVLSGVPNSLPSLIKAYRIQDKARNVGFDWKEKEDVWDKVQEELEELKGGKPDA